eukprot:TRINITY_DN801_c0_g1_i1.p1 TRINITY_DN801_c0_g1~~TRINITY_DN801_c0_g1_i1.p1  ORF type:complete len:212 (+),score=49.87 TRINITY_DN801_c0_g1_i1:53-637(+)
MAKTLKELSVQLENLFKENEKPCCSSIQDVLGKYAVQSEDFTDYIHFNDLHYTRNLVFLNDHFELMVLCWKEGQGSRIHSHTDSNCWMAVLDGLTEETRYVVKSGAHIKELVFPGPCPELHQIDQFISKKGDVGHINDEIGLHRVSAAKGTHAITLHLYSPPIKVANILDPEAGTTTKRTPGFYSLYGKRAQTA